MDELLDGAEVEQDEDKVALKSAAQPNRVAEGRKRRVQRAPNNRELPAGSINP